MYKNSLDPLILWFKKIFQELPHGPVLIWAHMCKAYHLGVGWFMLTLEANRQSGTEELENSIPSPAKPEYF